MKNNANAFLDGIKGIFSRDTCSRAINYDKRTLEMKLDAEAAEYSNLQVANMIEGAIWSSYLKNQVCSFKHLTSHDDVLDAFRMACKHYDTIHSAEESQRIVETKKQQIGSGFIFSAVGTSGVQQRPSAAELQSRRRMNRQVWQQAFNSDIR